MKKFKFVSILMVLCIALQCAVIPVNATEVTPEAETTQPASSGVTAVPDVEYGSASINYGCRTINGATPLGGSDRILETAQAAFIYEANTQTVIYAYNPDAQLMPGSLAKIMTAMIALEHMDIDQVITCSTRWNKTLPVNALNAEIKEGEEMTLNDLLHCLLVASANDAALIIANNIAPNEAAFVEMMNQKARAIGCTNTNFTNCHGLDDGNQYTSARDIAKITLEAYKDPVFKEIFGTTEYTIPPTNRNEKEKDLQTSNHMMYEKIINKFYDKRVKGGMPTYAPGSGAGLSCVAEDDKGMSLVMVLMGGTRVFNERGNTQYYGNFEETFDLLKFSFNNYRVCRLLYPGQMLTQFSAIGGNNQVTAQVDVAIDTVLPSNVNQKQLNFRYHVANEGLSAPIAKGDNIGTVQVWYHTSCITEAQMYAANEVRLATDDGLDIKGAARDDSNVTDILTFLGITCLVILIPLTIYIGINHLRRAMFRAKRRRRRRSRRRSR